MLLCFKVSQRNRSLHCDTIDRQKYNLLSNLKDEFSPIFEASKSVAVNCTYLKEYF